MNKLEKAMFLKVTGHNMEKFINNMKTEFSVEYKYKVLLKNLAFYYFIFRD